MKFLQNYKRRKLERKMFETIREYEFLKQEREYLLQPMLNTIPMLKKLIKYRVLHHKWEMMILK